MKKESQKVLVIKTKKLFPKGIWEGFSQVSNPRPLFKKIQKYGEYRLRSEVELDVTYKQLIPQIFFIVKSRFFIHKIPKTGNEKRLHNLYPIFLGGHVDEIDLSIEDAAEREFREEIDYKGEILEKKFLGLVNLQDNSVNSVHTGLVWVYFGDSEVFEKTRDSGVAGGKFVTWKKGDLLQKNMSYWSKVAYPTLKRILN